MSSLDPAPSGVDSYASLFVALGYVFDDSEILEHALTHRSWCAENPSDPSNERLEFLGDAILGVTITEKLFHDKPDFVEGDLAKARAEIVSASSLAKVARAIGVGPHLRLGKGEEASGGREKDSILADAMEAVIAAMYLDGGSEPTTRVLRTLLFDHVEQALQTPGERDYKTRLQERASELGHDAPIYDLSFSGPDHDRRFNATVVVGATVGQGSGSSKKQAQQNAAQKAFQALDVEPDTKRSGQVVSDPDVGRR